MRTFFFSKLFFFAKRKRSFSIESIRRQLLCSRGDPKNVELSEKVSVDLHKIMPDNILGMLVRIDYFKILYNCLFKENKLNCLPIIKIWISPNFEDIYKFFISLKKILTAYTTMHIFYDYFASAVFRQNSKTRGELGGQFSWQQIPPQLPQIWCFYNFFVKFSFLMNAWN